ncbi:MAG: protein-disulfide reductase DsbD, partial [Candidatus Contendobacter sp.]|nr:protein-disulfide reductase DsbD [Candidatus Contendobacter sp.]
MKHPLRARPWLALWLTLLAVPVMAGLLDRLGDSTSERILEADQAFQLTLAVLDPVTLEARWTIAPGYYLYRDKFRLNLPEAQGITIAALEIPAGESKEDPYFGRQAVFHHEAAIIVRLKRESSSAQTVRLKADYQGCAEIGVCYPPLSQTVSVALPPDSSRPLGGRSEMKADDSLLPADGKSGVRAEALYSAAAGTERHEAEQDRLARLLSEQRFLAIPTFFGLGLLLAFTPCIFPMVPILSSLIAGQGPNLSRSRALRLSLSYVLAMAATYTLAGVLAALLGQNVQAWFQNPWVISLFSGMFVLLALSMFGLYELQLPSDWQNRLVEWSNRQRGGQYTGVAVMGFLSALIVGPCVAPPLIGVLTFIAVTGDLTLGAVALF